MEKADIFISYRRNGGAFLARAINDRLRSKHYSVFQDVDTLKSGDYDQEIVNAITNCTDFIVILSPHSLQFSMGEDSNDASFYSEIVLALKEKKNVVPVIMPNFDWPESLPPKIQPLRMKNGLTASNEYYEASVEKLLSFLHSKPVDPVQNHPDRSEFNHKTHDLPMDPSAEKASDLKHIPSRKDYMDIPTYILLYQKFANYLEHYQLICYRKLKKNQQQNTACPEFEYLVAQKLFQFISKYLIIFFLAFLAVTLVSGVIFLFVQHSPALLLSGVRQLLALFMLSWGIYIIDQTAERLIQTGLKVNKSPNAHSRKTGRAPLNFRRVYGYMGVWMGVLIVLWAVASCLISFFTSALSAAIGGYLIVLTVTELVFVLLSLIR